MTGRFQKPVILSMYFLYWQFSCSALTGSITLHLKLAVLAVFLIVERQTTVGHPVPLVTVEPWRP